jgi:urea transporter
MSKSEAISRDFTRGRRGYRNVLVGLALAQFLRRIWQIWSGLTRRNLHYAAVFAACGAMLL